MPLIDANEALTVSGPIVAFSVNKHQKHVPVTPPGHSPAISKVENYWHLCLTIETQDEETVRLITMIRLRQHAHKGKAAADMIVWPL